MAICERCEKVFRNTYDLNRHLSRKTPCVKSMSTREENLSPKVIPDSPKVTLCSPKVTLDACEYCLHTFSSSFNKTRHICKHKEDTVRLLEIALKINIALPTCSTECRFCHKMLSKTATLTKHTLICQSRKDYYQQLLQQKNQQDEFEKLKEEMKKQKEELEQLKAQALKQPINYNNCNNCNNNYNILNVTIDYKEPPKNEHIKKETLQRILKEVYLNNKTRPEIAGGSGVAMYANEICKNPENRNVKLYEKSAIAKGFIDNCWVEMLKSNVIKEKFLSMCASMSQQISDYEITKPECVIEIIEKLSVKGMNIDELSTQDKNYLKQLFYVALRSFET
jgi:hypothetical protein